MTHEKELNELRMFKKQVLYVLSQIRANHLRSEDFEGRTFYPDHPRVILANLVESIEELSHSGESA